MVLNVNSANRYNRNRGYSSPLVRIIRREVGADEKGPMGATTSQAIHAWQARQVLPSLSADGKFGPRSLGRMIQSLETAGRRDEVALAKRFPHHDFTAAEDAETNLLEFRALQVNPIRLRALRDGFWCKGKFRVIIRFDPDCDASRYEYRQYIKGFATTQMGRFTSATPRMENWVATDALVDQSSTFKVPGGSLTRSYQEDGLVRDGSPLAKYGYRSRPPSHETDTTAEDRYIPDQASGHVYRCTDTPGLADPLTRPVGLRIRQKFMFQGRIIDSSRGNKTVATRHWKLEGDYIIT
ncbi:MAG: hypothetical protein AAFU85_22485 [Planctomycetota bacterium]